MPHGLNGGGSDKTVFASRGIQAGRIGVKVRVRLVIGDAEAAADRGRSLSSRIPRLGQSGREVVVNGTPKLLHPPQSSGGDLFRESASRTEDHVAEFTVGLAGSWQIHPNADLSSQSGAA